jgi:hypothetical protein
VTIVNQIANRESFDQETGELTGQLPAGYEAGNQSLAVSIAMAEIDQQITTARAYPRSITQAVKNILALATLDDETAKECVYALPRGGKPVKGPSIRLAEIIQQSWGNSRTGTRVVHIDRIEKYVEAEGVYHDLETNVATTARVRRRISDRNGKVLNEDMIIVTSNAAASIAKRNAILGGIPKGVWRQAYAAVERVIAGDVATLAVRRGEAMKAFAAFGVKPEQVFAALEVGGLDDIGLEEMSTLIGMHAALRSGEATVEEMFLTKPAAPASDKGKSLGNKLDDLAKGGDQTQAETKKSEPFPPGSDAGGDQSSVVTGSPSGKRTSSHAKPDGDIDPQARARARGAEHRAKGGSRKALPADYRRDESLMQAWFDGFDTGEAEDRDPGEEG